MFTRGDGTPSDGLSSSICQQAWLDARLDELLHCLAVARAFQLFELRAGQPPVHAPTTTAGAALAEERFQIAPTGGGDRVKLERFGEHQSSEQLNAKFRVYGA
jgi:hypothetical protein